MINISELSQYVLSSENMLNIINSIPDIINKKKKETAYIKKEQKEEKKNIDWFYPDKHYNDSLFWCWNIFINNNLQEYIFSNNNQFQVEKDNKINYVSLIRNNKQKLKELKIKRNNVENNLVNDIKLNLNTVYSLCIIHNCNFIYIDDYMYFNKIVDVNKRYCVIKKEKDNYGIYLNDSIQDIIELKNKLIVVDNIDKPLKSITNYKREQLINMCKILNIVYEIEGQKKFTKKKLYSLIQEKIN